MNLIDKYIEPLLHEYLGGICKALGCNPIMIGGYKEHVHILCLLSRQVSQMNLIEELKKRSSAWIKSRGKHYLTFYWQDGYGIFSVNPTEIHVVTEYIKTQHEHHRIRTFQEEVLAFLKKYKVEYDERFLWD